MKIAKVGDIIKWDFKGHPHEHLFSGIYTAEVSIVDLENKLYGVYAEYGQDYISFETAVIINKYER